jgi:predicted NAD-dependent protein-ADP-ribosyltransferase YbiA (DUF1768 family)
MVVSKIDKSVNYEERRTINEEDKGYACSLFETEILGKNVVITIGNENHRFGAKNIAFFPIYLVANNQIKSQIGVFEMKTGEVIQNMDEDGEIDIENMEPLLFSFVKPKFLEKSGSNPEFYYKAALSKTDISKADLSKAALISSDLSKKEIDKKKESDENNASDEEDDNDPKKLSTKHKGENKVTPIENSVFKIDATKRMPDMLPEETAEEADAITKKYKQLSNHNWIQKFMESTEYSIVNNEGSGDCFFCVIRDAFSQIGHETTVAKLRALVAKEITQDIYNNYLDRYLGLVTEIADADKEMADIKKSLTIYKSRVEKTPDKGEKQKILTSSEELTKKFKDLAGSKKITQDYLEDVKFMKNVHSLESFKEEIMKSTYWADELAISIIEHELNIKVIVLSEYSYRQGDNNAVMNCLSTPTTSDIMTKIRPKYYIITTHSGNHYQSVAYKGKKVFTFGELPYHIKTLIANKCMERNAGTFHMIPEFQQFIKNYNKHADIHGENDSDDDADDDVVKSDLYENKDVFLFHVKSANYKPGLVKGEKIDKSHAAEYRQLNKVADWRRMLDDQYESPFKLDSLEWKTIEHYYQASKFFKKNLEFYKQFSLTMKTDISEDVEMARGAGSASGKFKGVQKRPTKISIDPDFYGDREKEIRRTALMAKFSKNEELRRVLLNTKKAQLKHYVKGEKPVLDVPLMEVRKEII